MRVSLEDFVLTGRFGSIDAECTGRDLQRCLGDGLISHGYWEFGTVGIGCRSDFGRVGHIEVMCGGGTPRGGDGLKLDPWIIAASLTVEELCASLDQAGVGHSIAPTGLSSGKPAETTVATEHDVAIRFQRVGDRMVLISLEKSLTPTRGRRKQD